MDKFSQLVADARIPVAIVSDGADFQLTALDQEPWNNVRRDALLSGFRFIGVIGYVNGVPRVALDTELDQGTYTAISQAYVQFIMHRINEHLRQKGQGDHVIQTPFN